MKQDTNNHIYLILHNIRSAHNVGSIFRTADAVGVSKLFLTGYTPAPVDRFGRVRKDITKVSLGAEKHILWEQRKNILPLLRHFRAEGTAIVALEQHSHSVDYKRLLVKEPSVIILGNEVDGIEEKVLALCDSIVEIPMRGSKESLNVSVAAGIVLFRFFDRS